MGAAMLKHGDRSNDEPAAEWFRQDLQRRLPQTKIIVPVPGETHVI